MKTSVLFDEVVNVLGAGVREIPSDSKWSAEARAIAAYVKTHRTNVNNMFEMLEIMWPKAAMSIRDPAQPFGRESAFASDLDVTDYVSNSFQQDSLVVFDITFEDGSQGLIVSARGLTIEYEVVS